MPHRARTVSALLIAAVLLLMALGGCQRRGIEDLLGSELFSLSLGKLEDQIDLFQFQDVTAERHNSIFMRDGWFYIANGSAGKIMVFSSYGDLLFLLYNPQMNPTPTTLGPVDQNSPDEPSTRGAVAYPFSDISHIAVASDRTLYVEDAIADAKAVKDAARGLVLSRIILRFDRRGKPLGYIGQEGIGGTPFPFIYGMYVTGKDQLVVVCRLPDHSWEVSWFSKEGTLLSKVEIDSSHLPIVPDESVTPVLVTIMPDEASPRLYLLLYFYNTASETQTESARGTADNVVARVYALDLRTQKYDPAYVQFPTNPPRKEKVQLKTTEIPSPPSDLLGMGANGMFYLLAYTDTNLYTLQLLDSRGRVRATRHMVIEDSELSFRDAHLSSTGLVYGLLADRSRARVSWWRSDLLLKGE